MPFDIADFKRRGLYEPKPETESATIPEGGRNVCDLLPEKIRRLLSNPGGTSHEGDYSRQDSAVITSILSAGYSVSDAYTTFMVSPRGKHAIERKNGHVEDYVQRTIKKAQGFLNLSGTPPPSDNGNRVIRTDFSRQRKELEGDGINIIWGNEVEVERPRWLWPGYIPAGKITILAGDPGMGKSTISIDLVSRISQGTFLPSGGRTIAGTCLIASAEDAAEDTIMPRLIAAGANISRIGIIREVMIQDEAHYLSFPRDLERLRALVIAKGARLLIIDPMNAFMEKGTDTYKDQDVRLVLAPLESIAEETGVSILIVAHLNKKEESSTLYRVGGSIGFIGAARSVLAVSHTTKDDTRALYSLKSNLAKRPPSLAYETREVKVTRKDETQWKGEDTVVSSNVRWKGEIDFDPAQQTFVKESESETEAQEFLRALLIDSEMPTEDIFAEARQAGISKSSLNRVKSDMGIKAVKRSGRWCWILRNE